MARLTRDSELNLGNKKVKIDDVLKTIIYLPAEKVKAFFNDIGLNAPRELRMFVLREILRERVAQTRKNRLTLADELNYRLSWFSEFTETQLENLLVFYDDRDLDKQFLEEFWTDLFSYMVEKGVLAKDLRRLVDESVDHVKSAGLVFPNIRTYNRELKDLFFDSFGRIDGLTQQKFRPVLFKSSTLSEVRDLGAKYGVDVPRRLKKNELANIIINELQERNTHTDVLETEIRGMSVLQMQRYAMDHDIKASTELKKEEIIEYILANAKETKETYFVPESQEVYEMEPDQVAEQPEAEDTPTPKPEPVSETPSEEAPPKDDVEEEDAPEPVQETPVAKQSGQYLQAHEVDHQVFTNLSELVAELRRLRELVEEIVHPAEAMEGEASPVDFDESKPATGVPGRKEPVVLNSAEFYGNVKTLKKIIRNDEADDRETFIEAFKKQSGIGVAVDAAPQVYQPESSGSKATRRFFKVMFVILIVLAIIFAIVFILLGAFAAIGRATNAAFIDNLLTGMQDTPIIGMMLGWIDALLDMLGM